MKFQDSSFNGLKVITVGTKKCDARTLKKQYAPSTFFKVGGLIIILYLDLLLSTCQ